MRVSNFFNAPVVDDALIRKRATRLCSRKIIQKILTYLIFYVGVAYFVVHFPAILFLSWDKVTITAACTQYTAAYTLYTERNGPPRRHLLQTSKIWGRGGQPQFDQGLSKAPLRMEPLYNL